MPTRALCVVVVLWLRLEFEAGLRARNWLAGLETINNPTFRPFRAFAPSALGATNTRLGTLVMGRRRDLGTQSATARRRAARRGAVTRVRHAGGAMNAQDALHSRGDQRYGAARPPIAFRHAMRSFPYYAAFIQQHR